MATKLEHSPKVELQGNRLVWSGAWTAERIKGSLKLARQLHNFEFSSNSTVISDFSGVTELDTAGAWFCARSLRELKERNVMIDSVGLSADHNKLIALVDEHAVTPEDLAPPAKQGFFENIGRDTADTLRGYAGFMAFIGRLSFSSLRIAFTPAQLRWSAVVRNIEQAGFDALPIVGLLTFLLGMVIAYQGGIALQTYGASIYTADFVGLSMVRELSPLITAIVVAGRTGSAYTAEIATMKFTEEVDALRTMGISPIEELALPKFFALLVALPLLTVFGDFMGLLGGMVMANSLLDVSFTIYVDRVTNILSPTSFMIGIGKAPVFALMIAAVGCYQGFEVKASAEEVGKQTTISVVQAIFLVIVADAMFSIVFSKLGI